MKAYFVLLLIIAIVCKSVVGIGCANDGFAKPYKTTLMKCKKERSPLNQDEIVNESIPVVATAHEGFVKGLHRGKKAVVENFGENKTEADSAEAILYNRYLDNKGPFPELVLNGVGSYSEGGLDITKNNNVVRLNKFYALAERRVQYIVRFSADAKAVFCSSQRDFSAYVDVKNKYISIATNPVKKKKVDFLKEGHEYLVEIYHIYQKAKLRVEDIQTGESAEIEAINDGPGGVGKGAFPTRYDVGMQWDYYCFGLVSGTSVQIREIKVLALKRKVKLLMYGDSITQPEAYFSTENFSKAWTQRIINKLNGNAISSGRGGANIDMVLKYIKNELPFIEAKYVMVTIGTNGGNTEAKLIQLVNYIKSQGAIPILNNIPCNESGTQIKENKLIEMVRRKLDIKGCKFDMATSLSGDGKEVDKSLMFWEDYSGSYGWQIYHHPNKIGGKKMFEQALLDLPNVFAGK
jgi:hypothetical protein